MDGDENSSNDIAVLGYPEEEPFFDEVPALLLTLQDETTAKVEINTRKVSISPGSLAIIGVKEITGKMICTDVVQLDTLTANADILSFSRDIVPVAGDCIVQVFVVDGTYAPLYPSAAISRTVP